MGRLLHDLLLPLIIVLMTGTARAVPQFENVFGGDGSDTVLSIAPTATGYVVVGVTDSSDFPVTDASTPAGGTDLFVAKLGLDGTITAATRIGGSGEDSATGVVVDSTGLITVGGWTTSMNFPTVSPIQSSNGGGSDCLILQLDSNLVVQFATYLGGAGEEQFAGVTHQTNLDRFVFVGFTTSTQTQFPFPTPNGASADVTKTGTDTDGLLVALARDRTIPLATYHGISSGNEVLLAVDADPSGLWSQDISEVAVTGYTDADFFKRSGDPLGSGRKLIAGLLSASTGARLNSRLRSGNGDDEGHSVAYTSGKIVVGGRTTSTDFPVSSNAPQLTHGGGSDGLFVAFETQDFFSVYSTYLGGSGDDSVRGLAYDPAGHLHFAGTTASTNFPVGLAAVTPARQPAYGGGTTDGITGRIDVTGTGFGGAGPAIASFPTLSFSGGADEDGYLAAAHRPDGAGATGTDPYLAVSAGGRVVTPPAPAPLGDEDGGPVAMEGGGNEQAVFKAEGEALTGADVGLRIRSRYDMPDPTLPLGGPIELEFIVFNNGPSTATGVTAEATIPNAFGIAGSPTVHPQVGSATITGRELSINLSEVTTLLPVTVRLLVSIDSYPGPTIVVPGSVTHLESDPNLGNNTTETFFSIQQQPNYGDTFDIEAKVTIDTLPTANTSGIATISVVNHGQHIAGSVGVRVTRLYMDQSFEQWTNKRADDSVMVKPNDLYIGIAQLLRPEETARFTLTFRDQGPDGAVHRIQALALSNPVTASPLVQDRNPGNDLAYAPYRLGGLIAVTATPTLDGTPVPPGAIVTATDRFGNQKVVTAGANGAVIDEMFPGPGAISVYHPDGSNRFFPVNFEADATFNVPLGSELPVPSPLQLFRGQANTPGQVWCVWELIDGTIRTSPDLMNWQSRPEARSPFLLKIGGFEDFPDASRGFVDLESLP